MSHGAVLTPLRRLQLLVARTVNGVTTLSRAVPRTPDVGGRVLPSSELSSSSSVFDLVPSVHEDHEGNDSEREVMFARAQVAVSKSLVEAFFRDVRVNDVLLDLVQSIDALGPAVASPSDWLRLKALCLFELEHMAPSSIVTVLDLLTRHGVCGQVEAARVQNALAKGGGFASLSVPERVEFLYDVCAVDGVILSAALRPQVLECVPETISQCNDADLPRLAYILGSLLYDAALPNALSSSSCSSSSPAEYNMQKAFLERVMQSTNVHAALRASERIYLLFNCVRLIRRKHAAMTGSGSTQQEEELLALQRVADALLFNLRCDNAPLSTGSDEAMYTAGFGGLLGSVVVLGSRGRVEHSIRYAEIHSQLRSFSPQSLLQLFSAVHDCVALRTHNGATVDLLAAAEVASHTSGTDGARGIALGRDSGALLFPVHPRLFATTGELRGGDCEAVDALRYETRTDGHLQRMSDVMDAFSRHLLLAVLRCEIADTSVLVVVLQRLTRSGAMHLSKNTQLLQHLLVRALLYGYGDAIFFPRPWLSCGSTAIGGPSQQRGEQVMMERLFVVPPAAGTGTHASSADGGKTARCDSNVILGWHDTDLKNALIARLDKNILVDGDFLVRPGVANPAELLVVAETLARYPLARDYQETYARIVAQKLPTAVARMSSELDKITHLLAEVSALGSINVPVRAAVQEVLRTLKAPPGLHRRWNAILCGEEDGREGSGTANAADPRAESNESTVVHPLTASALAAKCCHDCVEDAPDSRRRVFHSVELLADLDGLKAAESATCRMVLRFLACTAEENEQQQLHEQQQQQQSSSSSSSQVSRRTLDAVRALYDRGLGEALQEARGGACGHLLEHVSYGIRLGVPSATLARALPVISECLTQSVRRSVMSQRGETSGRSVEKREDAQALLRHIVAFLAVVYDLQMQPSIVHPHLRAYLRTAILDTDTKLLREGDATAPFELLSTIAALLYVGEDDAAVMEKLLAALADDSADAEQRSSQTRNPRALWLPTVNFATAVSRASLATWLASAAMRTRLQRQLLEPLIAASRATLQPTLHPSDARMSLAAACATALLAVDAVSHEDDSSVATECAQLRGLFGQMVQGLFVEAHDGSRDASAKWSLASINHALARGDATFGTPGVSRHAQIMIVAQGIQAAAKRDTELKQHVPLAVAAWKQCVKRMDKAAQRVSQSTGDDNALLLTVAVALHFGISSQGTDAIMNRFLPPAPMANGAAVVKEPPKQPVTLFAPRQRVEPKATRRPPVPPPSPMMRRMLSPVNRVNAHLASLIAAGLVESGKRRPAATAFIASAVQTSDAGALPAHALHALLAFIARDAERVALGQTQVDSLAVLLWSHLDLKLARLSHTALVSLLSSTPPDSREYMLHALGICASTMTLPEISRCVKATADWEIGIDSFGEASSAVELGGVHRALARFYASVRLRMDTLPEKCSAAEKEYISEIEAFVGGSNPV